MPIATKIETLSNRKISDCAMHNGDGSIQMVSINAQVYEIGNCSFRDQRLVEVRSKFLEEENRYYFYINPLFENIIFY